MGTVRHEFTFERSGDGTQFTQALRLSPNLLGRLGAPVFKRGFVRRMQQIASELREYLDARKSAST